MLKVYGYMGDKGDILGLRSGLKDSQGKMDISPTRFATMLETHALIVVVRIETKSYRLNTGGIGVWVVLDGLILDKTEPRAVIYHPYFNDKQEYLFSDLLASMGGEGLGLWVRRRTEGKFESRQSAVPIT